MKKFLLFCIFISIGLNMNSQIEDFICATPDDDTPDPPGVYSYSIDPNYLSAFEPVVFNVFVWGINKDDGTSTNRVTQAMALKAVAELNMKYNYANIYFKYYGLDHLNSSRYYTIFRTAGHPDDDGEPSTLGDFTDFLNQNPQYMNDEAINIHIPYATVGFAGAGYWSTSRAVFNTWAVENSPRVVNHEVGHVFGISHTHAGWLSLNNCEHVTRDENNQDFNADKAGDWVVDTAAVPDFRNEKCEEMGYDPPYTDCPWPTYYYIENCEYDNPLGDDCLDPPVPYEIFSSDVSNLMSYTKTECGGLDLTIGQYVRIRDKIADNPNKFEPISNIVPSLYEPYSGSYYVSGAMTPQYKPLFQPGFDYKFVECFGNFPQPAGFYETFPYNINNVILSINKDETNYGIITHPNHSAIYILNHDLVPIPYPRRCYNNFNRGSIGGSVTKFNDGVFNTNVTITPKDSIAINNQNLIQNLNTGLYKIEKNYEDGSKEETVIYKGNN